MLTIPDSRCLRSVRLAIGLCLMAAGLGWPLVAQNPPPDLGTRKAGSDWPALLGPQSDGNSPETGLLKEWPSEGPRLVWVKDAGEGYAGSSIARGRLFFFDRADGKGRLRCLNAETGEELWRQEYPYQYKDLYGFSAGPRVNPLVDADLVFTYGVEGMLRCHRTEDGLLLWQVDTVERFGVQQNFFGVGSSPVVYGDLLIAMVGGSPEGSPPIRSGRKIQANGTAIVAFEKRMGKVRYQLGDDLASYSSLRLTEIGGRPWVFAFARGGLLAFDPRDGKVDFHFPWKAKRLETVNASNPVIAGDTVFLTEAYGPGGVLLKVRPGGYEVMWKDPPRRGQSLASHFGTPIHVDGFLYGSHGKSSGRAELRCIEHATGKIRWKAPGLTQTGLLHVDGHLVVLGEYGGLHLVEATPEEYRLKSTVQLKDASGKPLLEYPSWSPPALSRGFLYLRGKNRLVCLDLSSDSAKR